MKCVNLTGFLIAVIILTTPSVHPSYAQQPSSDIYFVGFNVNYFGKTDNRKLDAAPESIPKILVGFEYFFLRAGYQPKNVHYRILDNTIDGTLVSEPAAHKHYTDYYKNTERLFGLSNQKENAKANDSEVKFYLYPVHVRTRNPLGDMTRKLSDTSSHKPSQFLGTSSLRKSSMAVQNSLNVA